MAERRQSSRQKSFLRGCIYFNNRRSAVDCLVRDVSVAGARLIFSAAVNVPDVVDLYIAQKEQTLRAKVQWRYSLR
jgi:PilZ domain